MIKVILLIVNIITNSVDFQLLFYNFINFEELEFYLGAQYNVYIKALKH